MHIRAIEDRNCGCWHSEMYQAIYGYGKQLAGSRSETSYKHYAVSDSIAKTHFRNSCWKEGCVTLSIKHRGVVKGGTSNCAAKNVLMATS